MEFMTGAVKSNDVSLLQTFQKVFDLGGGRGRGTPARVEE
jgi:hypothetical protein